MTLTISPYLHFIDECRIDNCHPNNEHIYSWTVPQGIRILHIPTGIEVECHEDRSGHKNKIKALELMKQELDKIGYGNDDES